VETRVVLPPEPTSPRRARQHVSAALREAGLDDLVDDASLLVSELVTNALLHARSDAVVALTATAATVRVAVADRSPRAPVRRRHGADATTGRGLRLLEQLALRWGVDAAPDGKTVWFELPTDGVRPTPALQAERVQVP